MSGSVPRRTAPSGAHRRDAQTARSMPVARRKPPRRNGRSGERLAGADGFAVAWARPARPAAARRPALGRPRRAPRGVARRWPSPARSSCARSSTGPPTAPTTATFVGLALAVPRHRRRHPGDRRRRHPLRHRHGVGHDERAAAAHDPPRARPRPRVPPPHTPGELIQRVDGDVTSVSDFLGAGRAQGGRRRAARSPACSACSPCSTGASASAWSCTSASPSPSLVRDAAPGGRARRPTRWARSPGSTAASRSASRRPRTCAPTAPASHAMWRFVEDSGGHAAQLGAPRSGRSSACGGRCRARSTVGSVLALVVSAALVANGRDHARHRRSCCSSTCC